ncbi:hypothetical protein ACNJFJ_21420 [Mycobacterium tuberculosis]
MPESTDTTTTRIGLSPALAADFVLEKRDLDGGAVDTVDARRLHAFLGNGDAFANWIGDHIR